MKVVTAAEVGQFYTEEKQKRFNNYVPEEGHGLYPGNSCKFQEKGGKEKDRR